MKTPEQMAEEYANDRYKDSDYPLGSGTANGRDCRWQPRR